MISFLNEPTLVAITGSRKVWVFRVAGAVVPEGGAVSARGIAPATLTDVRISNSSCNASDSSRHQLREPVRPPHLDSAALLSELH